MGRYNSYPEYKSLPTGLLRSAPSSWDIKRLKYISSINDDVLPENTPPDYEFNYVDIGSVSMGKGIIRTEPMKFEGAPSRARRKVKTGDVIVSTVRTYLKAIAAIDRNADSLVVSTGFCVIRPRQGIVPRYCGYLMQAPFLVEQIVSESVGVSYPAINASQIANMAIPLPTEKEQTQIATFLDRETAKIDRLIEKQQRLIELLEEKRQAVISHAVTKGLNPDAPMKDSGVTWLGQVPEHWNCLPAKRIFRLATEPAPPNNNEELLSVYTDIGVRPRKDLEARGNKASTTDGYWRVKRGDLIVNKLLAWMGACGYSDYDGVTSPAYDILRPVKPINTKFYHYLFRSKIAQTEFKRWSRGIMEMRLRLYFDELGRIVTPIPPEEEQNRIVESIEAMELKFEKLSSKTSEAIALLQERRTALISAAVTGKIDVRDQVPQDVEEAVSS